MKFSIFITTKNRKNDLVFSLNKLSEILQKPNVNCFIFDDGSDDETFIEVKEKFSNVEISRNENSKGYIHCRNKMLNEADTDFAISLDDDAHFISHNSIETIENHFSNNPKCGLIAFRIFWSLEETNCITTNDTTHQVKSFVGCGHAWRTKAWKSIPNYPEWFQFYGEENFASLQLFKKGWEIHYLPQILVHHRVNLISRKRNADYQLRQRRSIRAGWYLYFMFYPLHVIPRKLSYTFWMQLKNKTFKGDWKATFGIFQALFDVLINLPKLIKQSNRLTTKEFLEYSKLRAVKLYWKPEDEE